MTEKDDRIKPVSLQVWFGHLNNPHLLFSISGQISGLYLCNLFYAPKIKKAELCKITKFSFFNFCLILAS